MKNKYLKIITISLSCFIAFYFVFVVSLNLFQHDTYLYNKVKNITANLNISHVTADDGIACNTDSDCNANFDNFNGVCKLKSTQDSFCAYEPKRPISLGNSSSPDYWKEESGLIDKLDVVERNYGFDSLSALTGEYKTLGERETAFYNKIKKLGKLKLAHITNTAIAATTECGQARPLGQDTLESQKNTCTEKAYSMLVAASADNYDGVAIDEYFDSFNNPVFFSALADAIKEYKQKNNNKIIALWGQTYVRLPGIPLNSDTPNSQILNLPMEQENLRKFLNYVDLYIPESYLSDNVDGGHQDGQYNGSWYKSYFNQIADGFVTLTGDSNTPKKILYGISIADSENWGVDQNPGTDLKKVIDAELSVVNELARSGRGAGVGLFTLWRSNTDTNSWLAKILQYYFWDGKVPRYGSDDPNAEKYIKNGSFETLDIDGNPTNWTVASGDTTSTKVVDWSTSDEITKLLKRGSYPKVPNGTNVMKFARGEQKNTISQQVNATKYGNYTLEVYSKKNSGDFGKSGINTIIQDENGNNINADYTKKTFYPVRSGLEYNLSINMCKYDIPDCTDQVDLWTKEEFIFNSPTEKVNVIISDESAEIGDINLVDFVQLQEREANFCGNNACTVTEKTSGSCPLDCSGDLFFDVKSDKKYVAQGGVILYTVNVKNNSAQDLSNMNVKGLIPAGTTYVDGSATNSGILDGTNLIWNISQIASGQSMDLRYQVKVQ